MDAKYTETCWKGFSLADLTSFGVQRTDRGVEVPYFTRDGQRYRHKLFPPDGRPRWVGRSKPQIPYGLDTLALGGRRLVLTEGESCALALRLSYPALPVLGIPGASSWQVEWRVYAEPFPLVYLSFDGDEAGDRLADAVMRDIPKACPLHMPQGFDTRDILQRLGKNAFRVLVECADGSRALTIALGAATKASERREDVERQLQEAARGTGA